MERPHAYLKRMGLSILTRQTKNPRPKDRGFSVIRIRENRAHETRRIRNGRNGQGRKRKTSASSCGRLLLSYQDSNLE